MSRRPCVACGRPSTHGYGERSRCRACKGAHIVPGALVHATLPYGEDVACQMMVRTFPDGASLESIADAMGVTHENVRQVETRALSRFAAAALRMFGPAYMDALAERLGHPEHSAGPMVDAWRTTRSHTRPAHAPREPRRVALVSAPMLEAAE